MQFIFFAILGIIGASSSNTETSFADENLLDIVTQQYGVYQKIETAPHSEDKEHYLNQIQKKYEAFIKQNPEHILGKILYGKFLRSIGAEKIAHAIFLQAYDQDPNLSIIHQQLANYYAETGYFLTAFNHLIQAILLSPFEPTYYQQLGILLLVYQNSFLAHNVFEPQRLDSILRSSLKQAAELSGNWNTHFLSAQAYLELCIPDYPTAIHKFQSLLVSAPSFYDQERVYLQLANAFYLQGNIQQSRAYLNEVYSCDLEKDRQALLQKIALGQPFLFTKFINNNQRSWTSNS